MGPELLWPEEFNLKDSRPTKASDCYALGMVILEVLSGKVPFAGDGNCSVMRKVTSGERPKRPQAAWFTDDVWEILEHCWVPKPQDRPKLEVVHQCLEKVTASWTTLSQSIHPTGNSSERDLPEQEEVSQVTPPSRKVMSKVAQNPTMHSTSSGPENSQVWPSIHPPVPTLTSMTDDYAGPSSFGQDINPVYRPAIL